MDSDYEELRRATDFLEKESRELRDLFTALHQRVAGLERRVGELGNDLQAVEGALRELLSRRES
jgi:predicted nuclease with TOPRIM domain